MKNNFFGYLFMMVLGLAIREIHLHPILNFVIVFASALLLSNYEELVSRKHRKQVKLYKKILGKEK